jgi:hypothetical protein
MPIPEIADRIAFLLWHAPLQRQMHTERFLPAKLGRISGGPQPWRVRDRVILRLFIHGPGRYSRKVTRGALLLAHRAGWKISGIHGEIFEKAPIWIR